MRADPGGNPLENALYDSALLQEKGPKLYASIHLPWSVGIRACILERFQHDQGYPAGSNHVFREWTYYQQTIPISLHLAHNLGGDLSRGSVVFRVNVKSARPPKQPRLTGLRVRRRYETMRL